jgi:hypothetical protein
MNEKRKFSIIKKNKNIFNIHLTDFQIVQQVTKENPSTDEIQQYRQQFIKNAIQEDLQHGPTLSELISPDLIEHLLKKQQDAIEKLDPAFLKQYLGLSTGIGSAYLHNFCGQTLGFSFRGLLGSGLQNCKTLPASLV